VGSQPKTLKWLLGPLNEPPYSPRHFTKLYHKPCKHVVSRPACATFTAPVYDPQTTKTPRIVLPVGGVLQVPVTASRPHGTPHMAASLQGRAITEPLDRDLVRSQARARVTHEGKGH